MLTEGMKQYQTNTMTFRLFNQILLIARHTNVINYPVYNEAKEIFFKMSKDYISGNIEIDEYFKEINDYLTSINLKSIKQEQLESIKKSRKEAMRPGCIGSVNIDDIYGDYKVVGNALSKNRNKKWVVECQLCGATYSLNARTIQTGRCRSCYKSRNAPPPIYPMKFYLKLFGKEYKDNLLKILDKNDNPLKILDENDNPLLHPEIIVYDIFNTEFVPKKAAEFRKMFEQIFLQDMSLQEIGDEMGITRQRVSQLFKVFMKILNYHIDEFPIIEDPRLKYIL
jgi:predicted DNA-binding protein YlxM (UPF0122 family)